MFPMRMNSLTLRDWNAIAALVVALGGVAYGLHERGVSAELSARLEEMGRATPTLVVAANTAREITPAAVAAPATSATEIAHETPATPQAPEAAPAAVTVPATTTEAAPSSEAAKSGVEAAPTGATEPAIPPVPAAAPVETQAADLVAFSQP